MTILNSYPEVCESPKCVESYHDSLLGSLEKQKLQAEKTLANINAAISALKANPEVSNILELLRKV